jgi:hypothetical protein
LTVRSEVNLPVQLHAEIVVRLWHYHGAMNSDDAEAAGESEVRLGDILQDMTFPTRDPIEVFLGY